MKPPFIRRLAQRAGPWLMATLITCCAVPAWSDELSEYQLKAAFLYNFTTFTEWPTEVGGTLNLCVYGQDPFGDILDELQGEPVGNRRLNVRRTRDLNRLEDCQIVFIARSASGSLLPQVLNKLDGKPVLTVADTTGAARRGVALNLSTHQDMVTFEVNLVVARDNGLRLSARLLPLAMEVIQ